LPADAVAIHQMLSPYAIVVRHCHLTSPPPPHCLLQILFDNKKRGDILNNCLMTVDGTDFRVPQKGTATKGNAFESHKYAGKSALRYELGVSILGGDLVWIQGPYPAGKFTILKYSTKCCIIFWTLGSESRPTRGMSDTPTKLSVPRM
jgi:hypothetical protein